MSRLFRSETVFFLVCWLAVLGLFRERGFFDPGTLWHTRVGEIILTEGFPSHDPFTYTHPERVWIPQQWGAEVLMALAHRISGLDTMLLGFATGLSLLFTWIFVRMRRAGMHPILAAILTAACLFPSAYHFFVRPHMFTIALLGWTMAVLVDYERGRSTEWRLVGLIPLYIIWTNLHGGVLGGVMTFGLAVIGWGLIFLWNLRHGSAFATESTLTPIRSWRTAFLLAGIVIACQLTPFVNPFGMEMLNTWSRLVGSTVLKTYVSEHKPLELSHTAGQVTVGFAIFYFFLLAGIGRRLPRVTWFLPIVWFVLTLDSIRQGPLFIITAAFVIPEIWPHTIWCRLLQKHGDSLIVESHTIPPLEWRASLVPSLVVCVALGLQIAHIRGPLIGDGWARLSPRYAPLQLLDQLQAFEQSEGEHARIYNDANLGGFLIYHTPNLKIFMDDRFELYPEQWTIDYVEVYKHHPERFEEWVKKYHLEMALVVTSKTRSPLDEYLAASPHWKEVGRTECAALYQRVK